jgi:WXG100 family type VII secretion target
MSSFTVTPESLAQAASSCNTTAGDIQSELSGLRGYIVGNMESWWQGPASTAFQELMQDYDVYSGMLYQALTDIAAGLNGNWSNYTDQEQANYQNMTNLQVSLPAPNLG